MALPTLQAALGGLADAAELLELDGRVVYVNPAFERLTGHDAGGLVGRHISDVHEAVSVERAAASWSGRVDAKSSSGGALAFDGSYSVVSGDDGAPRWVLGLLRDVTRQLHEERALRQSEELYRQIFHSNQAIKLLVDPSTGLIEDANLAACDFYGYTPEELRGLHIDRINTLPRERLDQALLVARQSGSRTFRFQHRRKSGELREVEVFTGGVEVGGRYLLLSIVHDVTERVRAEAQLARAQRMDSLGRLAGGVAHDFNNLLFVVLGEARIVLRGLPEDDPLRAEVERIRDAATRASELTRHLLLFARGGDVTPEPSDVHKTLRGVASLVSSTLGHDVRLSIEAPAGVRPVAYIATAQLEQVLVNLIINAREAMPHGGRIVARLRVVSDPDVEHQRLRPGDYAELEIVDDGVGMPKEIVAHVFEPFFTTKGPEHGTGLGLAITYGIVHRAGGAISVESEVGVGTTFRVWLPLLDGLVPDDTPRGDAGSTGSGERAVRAPTIASLT